MKKLNSICTSLVLMISVNSCMISNSGDWTKSDMVGLIQEKSDLKLPENFQVLFDSVKHTKEAFDSDYIYNLDIEYNQSIEKNIVEQITTSTLFDTINTSNYADPIWNLIHSSTEKGIWAKKLNGFEFLPCNNDKNRPEPFLLTVDTLTNRIKLNLIHL